MSGILGGRPVAGKTGSSEDNSTETFVGFTPQIAAAGIAVNVDNPNDQVGSGVAGAVNAAVAQTIAAALRGQPVQAFRPPSRAAGTGPLTAPRQAEYPRRAVQCASLADRQRAVPDAQASAGSAIFTVVPRSLYPTTVR